MDRDHRYVIALLIGLPLIAASDGNAAQAGQPAEPHEIVVVGVPLSGGIPADRLPANSHDLSRAALDEPGSATLGAVLPTPPNCPAPTQRDHTAFPIPSLPIPRLKTSRRARSRRGRGGG